MILAKATQHGRDLLQAWLFFAPFAALIVAVFAAIHVCTRRKQKRQYQELVAAADAEYKRWRHDVAVRRGLQTFDAEVSLEAGERCHYKTVATLAEPRAVRDTSHLGGAMRVAKGVAVLAGSSHSESHDEWRELSSGVLYVTNRRIIFDGEMHSRSIKLSTVMSLQAEPLSLAVSLSNRQKTVLFTGINGKIAQGVINIVRNSSR